MPPHTSGGRSCLPPCPRSSARSTTWGPCPSAKMTKFRYCRWNCCGFNITNISVQCICLTFLCCLQSGCPWTLQRPADWQSGAGLQEEVRHLHRACAERKGQWNHSPCRHPPQQGEMQLFRSLNRCACLDRKVRSEVFIYCMLQQGRWWLLMWWSCACTC